ncbi:hypothetical protein [Pseudorhodoferax sp. Leaf274]|uniref:hypothetical protein n=1 Tax=Pseudorhodoferax sp. Leaf274 TaxID=1736318 RepID=UPI00070250D8|nr:hypothetical protein [Pseudorhodoferax sp. Leaf274]KQP39687.1 hypothetical protein ASF44_08120 [Pseudorhodoferax sp. Leaf274]
MAEQDAKNGIAKAVIDPSAETISQAPAPVTPRDESAFFHASKLEHDRETNRLNLGYLGRFFGANPQTPVHVAATVAVAATGMLLITFWVDVQDASQLRSGLFTIISTSLAYIFGSNSK